MFLLVEMISRVLQEGSVGRAPESYRNRASFKYLRLVPFVFSDFWRNQPGQASNVAGQLAFGLG